MKEIYSHQNRKLEWKKMEESHLNETPEMIHYDTL